MPLKVFCIKVVQQNYYADFIAFLFYSKFCLPQAVEIAVGISRNGLLVGKGKGYNRRFADFKTFALHPINLGEFGPVDADEYRETTVNDLRQLFGEDQNLINIYLAWIMLVAEKNAGRQIDGKTYLESFSNACHSHIDLVKTAEIRAVENEADEKKKCVSAFVSQIAPAKKPETDVPQKQ